MPMAASNPNPKDNKEDATVIKLLLSNDMVGSLGNLYQSIGKFNSNYLQSNINKETFLNPKYLLKGISSTIPLFCSNFPSKPTAQKLYLCLRLDYGSHEIPDSHKYVAIHPKAWCPRSKNKMSSELTFFATDKGLSSFALSSASGEEGYVKGATSCPLSSELLIKEV
ncbi:hypothetical protein FEM48_Zijuj03G0076300 [Ziziphus jujuba var. spinosa]|uniref:Uncharacterized protein n=1 Tax=Ziziphus jujuba var. spinosa TaxID=714518 RepID=A0A978VP08_ZIZJJ|nr:hypothetical protein FEM48_Zijuj03G0076300 [Ziziphus jujuba var. spinosa]